MSNRYSLLNKGIKTMKKLLLLCTLVSVHQLYGMETSPYQYCTNIISHAYSYLPSFFSQSPKESEYIEILRKDKNNFEQKLNIYKIADNSAGNIGVAMRLMSEAALFNMTLGSLCNNRMKLFPNDFLLYCYYQKFHTNQSKGDMEKLVSANFKNLPNDDLDTLNKYKAAQIDGYSAIGAAILAPDVSVQSKREFINQLFELGFKPTKKDIMLAELVLYDAIPKENMMLFLHQEDLLPEIKRNIINCLIEQYWPLPEITSDKK